MRFDNDFCLLDGAMGTVLQSRGLKTGDLPELLNLTHADMLLAIHKEYIAAGSRVIYANTFGANGRKLKPPRERLQATHFPHPQPK